MKKILKINIKTEEETKMKLCSIYTDVSDKIKGVIFAKKIAEAEAEAAADAE